MLGVQACTIEALGIVCSPEATTGVEFPPVLVLALLALYDSRSEGIRIVPPDFASTAVHAFQAAMRAAPSRRLWLLGTPTWSISRTSPRPCRTRPRPSPRPLNYARGLLCGHGVKRAPSLAQRPSVPALIKSIRTGSIMKGETAGSSPCGSDGSYGSAHKKRV